MIKGRLAKNIFLAIDRILTTGEIIFSRQSLCSKLDKLSLLEGGDSRYLSRNIDRLINRSLIKPHRKGNQVFYQLTPVGLHELNLLKFKEPKILHKKWDGFWRVVVFDIPETNRIGRDALRRKLKYFGFYSLQKSVFVAPFKCENEINFLADLFDVSGYIEIFLTRSIGRKQEEIKRFFGI